MKYEVPIERGKIREFVRATRALSQQYCGVDAVIPPTFLTVARHFWEPRSEDLLNDIGFDVRRVLHGEEEYVFHCGPPQAGESLWAQTRVDATWDKQGRRGGRLRFARLVTEFRDATDALVAEQRTTLIETAQQPTESRG
jgi:hypothetical protein